MYPMTVLIIDNKTKHIEELVSLVHSISGFQTRVIPSQELPSIDLTQFQYIVLSGSSKHPVSSLGFYQAQQELILHPPVPLLGICAGFELICQTFDNYIKQSPVVFSGLRNIQVVAHAHKLLHGFDRFTVFERHRFHCPTVSPPLHALAVSDSGVEVVAHESLPLIGCQFHPEVQFPTNEGKFILERFLTM